jgi:hypothetical protein
MKTIPKANDELEVAAAPHKRFFIDMITRDISLEACVLDLIDNSVDGATRATEDQTKKSKAPKPHPLSSGGTRYKDYRIDVKCTKSGFKIQDNCGGIGVDIARHYAFNFGRDPQKHTDADTDQGIGIYGIGMKRALFKIGRKFAISSHTDDDAFTMDVDVDAWAQDANDWKLMLTVMRVPAKEAGTTIEVTALRPGVAEEFSTSGFTTRLMDAAARTYAAFLDQGLEVKVNGSSVKPTEFKFLSGDKFQALHERSTEQVPNPSGKKGQVDIDVEIWAGAAMGRTGGRPDTGEDDDASVWGWYVLCNNRVVLSADKTERTGWGPKPFPQWHPQYNGFIGIVSFRSDEPYALPWTTTKNDIDTNSVTYRKARARMQRAASQYIKYSRVRKANIEGAKEIERSAKSVRLDALYKPQQMRTPSIPGTTSGTVTLTYQRSQKQVAKAAAALKNPSMPATQVGAATFDYFYKHEVE